MAEASSQVITEGTARFTSDSQLLSELGERLIANQNIALAELIKNAYDADATRCHIWLEDDASEIIVQDDGHGMTEEEFLNLWMVIATSNRTRDPTSKRYEREVTGEKGVGRFAVRHLGRALELQSIAYYPDEDEYRRLVAEFDWEKFETGQGLQEMEIDYRVERGFGPEEEGTTLRISKLQDTWDQEKLEETSNEVLDIVSAPYENNPQQVAESVGEDPGFEVYFAKPGNESVKRSPASEIYERFTARVEITVDGDTVHFDYEYEDGDTRTYTFDLETNRVGSVSGEIRYFSQRKGNFSGMETLDGRKVNSWLRENGGVRVIDRQFRVPPYGATDNDWLALSQSQALRERRWRSPFTNRILPDGSLSSEDIRTAQLQLPRKNQVLGAVHISSFRPTEGEDERMRVSRLTQEMDRQGLLENQAFEQLRDITRASLEILAIFDFEKQKESKEEKAEEKAGSVKDRIEEEKRKVKERVDLPPSAKEDLSESYDRIGEEVEELQEAQAERQTAVESMHLLGVVTGFMSHETDNMLQSAERMLSKWREVPEEERDAEFKERLKITEKAVEDLQNHLGYTKKFMRAIDSQSKSTFKVSPRVEEIIDQFETYTSPRHVEVENNVPNDLESPEVNISLYSGVLLNLFSNAVKAVLPVSLSDGQRLIQFEAKNTDETHIVRISDTGVGLPEGQEDRIYDPMFSTRNIDEDSPLGGGTGMGLYIVKRVLSSIDGEISTVDPPEGFKTCFEVRIPL